MAPPWKRQRARSRPGWRDQGAWIPGSLFEAYLRPGELVIHPFFEYTLDKDREYQPEEDGRGPGLDPRGRFRGTSSPPIDIVYPAP